MSPQQLAPSRVVQDSVSYGRDLEIPTTLWRRESRTGHELELERLDPDGCMVRTRSNPHQQENGHTSARSAAGTAVPVVTQEDHSSCATCVHLTGAFLWVRAPERLNHLVAYLAETSWGRAGAARLRARFAELGSGPAASDERDIRSLSVTHADPLLIAQSA